MLGFVAVWISPLPAVLQALIVLGVCGSSRVQWRKLCQTKTLYHHGGPDNTVNQWTLVSRDSGPNLDAHLQNEGYRSANLLVLVFKPDNGAAAIRIPVWSDSVSAMQFSYLNAQLMFNTRDKR